MEKILRNATIHIFPPKTGLNDVFASIGAAEQLSEGLPDELWQFDKATNEEASRAWTAIYDGFAVIKQLAAWRGENQTRDDEAVSLLWCCKRRLQKMLGEAEA